MKGSMFYQKDRGRWAISWYHNGRTYTITRYKGEFMYHPVIADKCLRLMQNRWEDHQQGKGQFRIEEFTGKGWTDVLEYYEEWMKEVIEPKRKPATIKGYWSYYHNWIKPFFEFTAVRLHEIQLDTLTKLLNSIKLSGKGKLNVMMALHAMMDYAWRSKRISEIPPFPKREDYNIVEPVIEWIDSETFWQVIDTIPANHRPIFLWMHYHIMREAEACAIQWKDWDEVNRVFMVRRSVSARQVVDSTKTGEIYPTPCHSEFYPYVRHLARSAKEFRTPFIFTNPRARRASKRYTNESLNNIWKAACKKVGVAIGLYAGIRHSRASQMHNELKMSLNEIKEAGPWKRMESVERYAKTTLTRKRELLERAEVVNLNYYKTTTNRDESPVKSDE